MACHPVVVLVDVCIRVSECEFTHTLTRRLLSFVLVDACFRVTEREITHIQSPACRVLVYSEIFYPEKRILQLL